MRHEEDDESSDAEDALHDGHHGRVLIHPAECFCGVGTGAGQQVERGVNAEKDDGEAGVVDALSAFLVGTEKEVCHKQDEDDCQQRELFVHEKKL